jgi:NADH-ubiquinone oxidoreductase chain 3
MTFFIIFVCIIAVLFLVINLVFAPHNPYQEKYSIFECGFHSFLGQNRTQFGVKFFIFALVYLLLDLEILLTFPFAVSGYVNNIYGLMVTLGFIGIITVGFVYELGKSALKIDSRQNINKIRFNSSYKTEFIGKLLNNEKSN